MRAALVKISFHGVGRRLGAICRMGLTQNCTHMGRHRRQTSVQISGNSLVAFPLHDQIQNFKLTPGQAMTAIAVIPWRCVLEPVDLYEQIDHAQGPRH